MKNADDNLKAQTPDPADAEERNERKPEVPARGPGGHGFFSVYKSGQGYWTRMCTLGAAVLIGLLSARFIYVDLLSTNISEGFRLGPLSRGMLLALVTGLFLVGYFLLCFWLMNKPTSVDFLIATDSEMKKVNWTSRKELIGSTKVVVLFMFAIAAFLFLVDVAFGYFFFLIKVLKTGPFG